MTNRIAGRMYHVRDTRVQPKMIPLPPFQHRFCTCLQLLVDRNDILTVVEKRRAIQLYIYISRYSIDNNYL